MEPIKVQQRQPTTDQEITTIMNNPEQAKQ